MADSKEPLLRFLDYVFILRPTLLFPVWVMGLVGYRHGLEAAPEHSVLYILFLFSLLAGAVYILNQTMDIQTDRLNQKLFLISEEHVPRKLAILEAIILIFLAVILTVLSSLLLGGFFCLVLLAGILYNYEWKNHLWGGLVLNMVSYGTLVFSIGWICASGFQFKMFFLSLPYWLAIASIYLVTTLQDTAGDRGTGKQTFAVIYGEKLTMEIASFLLLLTVVIGALFKDAYLVWSGILALPFFVWSLITKNIQDIARGARVALLVFSLLLCISFPFFIVFLALNYFGSKWYYKTRFNIHYPYIFERIF